MFYSFPKSTCDVRVPIRLNPLTNDGDPDSRKLESGFGSRPVISKKVYVVEAKKASRVNMHINVLSHPHHH